MTAINYLYMFALAAASLCWALLPVLPTSPFRGPGPFRGGLSRILHREETHNFLTGPVLASYTLLSVEKTAWNYRQQP